MEAFLSLCRRETRAINDTLKEHYLILGFFDRGNIGDDAFVLPYKQLFPDKALTFQCIDDTKEISEEYDAVIVAGGDVINDYFMKKMEKLLITYSGPCYAVSVGVPYTSEAKYTALFDHVFVRTHQDVELLNNIIGSKNVDYIPDVTWCLKKEIKPIKHTLFNQFNQLNPFSPFASNLKPLNFAVCLAQPAFHKNEHAEDLIDSITDCIRTLIRMYPKCTVNLVAFNYSPYEWESDYEINDKVFRRLSNYKNVKNIKDPSLQDPKNMMRFISKQSLVIGMRFHSIVFSMIQEVPFIAMYATRKVENLLRDHSCTEFGYRLPTNSAFKPTAIDKKELTNLIKTRIATDLHPVKVDIETPTNTLVNMINTKKRKHIKVTGYVNRTLEETFADCKKIIMQYLKIEEDLYTQMLHNQVTMKSVLWKQKKRAIDVSRLICFGITNKIGAPYVWGLNDHILKNSNFCLYDAIKWIYEDHVNAANANNANGTEVYYPEVHPPRKNVIIDMNYMCQDNYQGLHRSGWSYVIGGLQHLDTRNNNDKPPKILVDTCLERTFLWGLESTKTAGIVPYQKPWVGFVHHTFDTDYSTYNCETLIRNKDFIQSLPSCKAIITLSDYLKEQFTQCFKELGYDINVITLDHPTEFVPESGMFTMEKFKSNQEKKVMQIGAWLRNSYAIYALPIPPKNKLGLTKCALKGREMDSYFKPSYVFDDIFDMLDNYDVTYDCEDLLCRDHCLSRIPSEDLISRSNQWHRDSYRLHSANKYLQGMMSHLIENDKSVKILEHTPNSTYDKLLSENVVFLNLIDASACNTVVECIVRNTPLIVNRLPALEEVLGEDYPGFYETGDMFTPAALMLNEESISKVHEYLKHMDKERFTLQSFINDFQSKLAPLLNQ